MKYILTALLSIYLLKVSAQQTAKVDDAVLLEFYQTQHFLDATNYLKGIYPEPINDIKALSQLAYTSKMAGKLVDAEAYYNRVYDKDSTNQASLYSIAGINLRKGNILKAELYYKKILQKDTTNVELYTQLAQIAIRKNDTVAYVRFLQKANYLNPVEPDVATDLSNIYLKLNQLPQAEKVLNLAIAADPENISLLESQLKLYVQQKKWDNAIKTCGQLITLGDNSATTNLQLGIAYYETKNYQCGLEILLAMKGMDKTETSYYYIGVCYKQLKDHKNAIINFNEAIKASISYNISVFCNEMADSYETIKQYKKALSGYQKSIQLEEKPLTYYFLADLYDTKLKDSKNALKYFKKYVAMKPIEQQKVYVTYAQSRITLLSTKQLTH